MDLTTLGLKKPLVTEAYDLQIVNDNADKVNELITADRAQINDLVTQGDWIEPTLLSNWTNFGPGTDPVSYMKDSLGFVHLRGVMKNGSIGPSSPAFYLPEGYRPTGYLMLSATSNGSSQVLTQVDISNTTGKFQVVVGGNIICCIDNIIFKAGI